MGKKKGKGKQGSGDGASTSSTPSVEGKQEQPTQPPPKQPPPKQVSPQEPAPVTGAQQQRMPLQEAKSQKKVASKDTGPPKQQPQVPPQEIVQVLQPGGAQPQAPQQGKKKGKKTEQAVQQPQQEVGQPQPQHPQQLAQPQPQHPQQLAQPQPQHPQQLAQGPPQQHPQQLPQQHPQFAPQYPQQFVQQGPQHGVRPPPQHFGQQHPQQQQMYVQQPQQQRQPQPKPAWGQPTPGAFPQQMGHPPALPPGMAYPPAPVPQQPAPGMVYPHQVPQQPPPGMGYPATPQVPPTIPAQQPGADTPQPTGGTVAKPQRKGKGQPVQEQGGQAQQAAAQQQPKVISGRPQPQQPKASGAPPQHQQARQMGPPTSQIQALELSGTDIKPMEFVRHPPGTKGRKIPIETNHLRLMLGNLKSAVHYDVALVPDTPKKFLRKVMELFRAKYYPNRYPAFDGRKNLYSTNLLPFGETQEGEVTLVDSDGKERKYKVTLKFANMVDLTPLSNYELSRDTPREALQVVDIVLRCAPAQSLITVGRSFFVKPPQIIDLGEGMEMYHGFYQSAIRGWKPFLNVDVAHKAFPKGMKVVDALIDVLSSGYYPFQRENLSKPLDRNSSETFGKFIKTLRVIYEIPGIPSSKRGYRVNGIEQSARDKVFTLDDGKKTTIEQYFATQKRFRLKYPLLPTLWVGDKNRPNPILVPLELCTLEESQVVNRKMTENQTSKMIKSSATNTDTRKQKIFTGMQQANYNAHPTIKEFGFSVNNVFEKLDARVLVPPTLGYLENKKVNPSKGVWRGDRFFLGATINKWTIVAADRRPPRPDDFNQLEENLFNQAKGCGLIMTTRAQKPYDTIGGTLPEIKKYFQNQVKKYDVIFVIVPNSGPQYSFVKQAAEITAGCLTQCVKLRTVGRINVQTAVNILLKVNAKMNGTNHCLLTRPLIMNRPTMIMGADVTHPSPDARDIPSVAAVTASHDPKAFKYNICWRLQSPKQEIIDDLEKITLEHLNYFYKMNKGMKPERIIFFRDGVSEGQFEEVRRAEIRAIRSACKKIQETDYEPAITFLVVQKRHHTRLFPLNPRDSEDRNNNVPAGTCIDFAITHPFLQDFYLVSHASIQGVAKPTKYCTLWDDNSMSNDDIEELTYFLCHMFTRCNRSVSYPAPTYYAHLAAARAKVYIENDRINLDNLSSENEKYKILDCIRKDRPMFFV